MNKQRKGFRMLWRWGIFVLALILAVVAVVRYGLFGDETTSTEISYLLRVEDVSATLHSGHPTSMIPVGTEVRNAKGSMLLGYVVEVWTSPALGFVEKDGETLALEHPERCHLWIRVKTEAQHFEGEGYRVSSIRIAAGARGDFLVGSFLAEGARILSVEEVQK